MAGEEDLVVHVRLVVRLVVDLVAVVGLYGFFIDHELRVGEEVLVDLCADLGGEFVEVASSWCCGVGRHG